MVPQSYNIFSNDMLLRIDNDVHIYNYADDNTLCSGYDYETVNDKLLHNVNLKVTSCFEDNHMQINPDKLQYIAFGKH